MSFVSRSVHTPLKKEGNITSGGDNYCPLFLFFFFFRRKAGTAFKAFEASMKESWTESSASTAMVKRWATWLCQCWFVITLDCDFFSLWRQDGEPWLRASSALGILGSSSRPGHLRFWPLQRNDLLGGRLKSCKPGNFSKLINLVNCRFWRFISY